MVALLFVVVASALQRMYLYTSEFGLTELRLYTTIFMVWISVVLVWFVLTVLRARRDRFAFGALIAGFAAIFAINAMNPDALIASTNIDRLEEGKRFDAYYLTTLSADAVPVIVESLPEIGQKPVWQDSLPSNRRSSDSWGTETARLAHLEPGPLQSLPGRSEAYTEAQNAREPDDSPT